ncbi:PcfJ domain-containing protein [Jannaschia pohangensis]|uniref:Uncharacterized protein n=1 Tax=Jannaschia pohangensis TaxID=390807 RepID=A0A1I3GR08_9RHOB|nr:PcfJ domain-containing protein [Jannaschia pohangensis]SFI25762.1 hypothetical protein SAMN04488095_0292 [Jannaschia pohangensis]
MTGPIDTRGVEVQQPLSPPEWYSRLCGQHRSFFAGRLSLLHDAVLAARRDGLEQLVPIILALGVDVAEIRAQLGRHVWRKLHHADEDVNFRRVLIWLRFEGGAAWDEIVTVPQTHLRSCRNAVDWPTARYAARLADVGRFLQVSMLYRDTIKMGGAPRDGWSLKRLKREHDRRAVSLAINDADSGTWAPAYTVTVGDYVFTRLTSDRDLVREGKTQRHCVATFREDARRGACVVMACTGAERATLRFGRSGDRELGGFANSQVSAECLAASLQAQREFERSQGLRSHSCPS